MSTPNATKRQLRPICRYCEKDFASNKGIAEHKRLYHPEEWRVEKAERDQLRTDRAVAELAEGQDPDGAGADDQEPDETERGPTMVTELSASSLAIKLLEEKVKERDSTITTLTAAASQHPDLGQFLSHATAGGCETCTPALLKYNENIIEGAFQKVEPKTLLKLCIDRKILPTSIEVNIP